MNEKLIAKVVALYMGTVGLNIFGHWSDSNWAFDKALTRRGEESEQLSNYGISSLEKIAKAGKTDGWIFFPGSYWIRREERPKEPYQIQEDRREYSV